MALKRQRLVDLRKIAGYTQERLAEALGVERSTVARWERAETEPQQVHLDLATASARRRGGDPIAVLHLLEIERLAPQVLRANVSARTVLDALLRRERRYRTPGPRPLAQRAGALA